MSHFRETSQYHDELMRELRLIVDTPSSSRRLNQLAATLLTEFSDFAPSIREAVERADARGEQSVDLCVRVTRDLRHWLVQFRDHFREIDAFSEAGLLLALGSPGVALVFREWLFGELIDQIDGKEPQAYQ